MQVTRLFNGQALRILFAQEEQYRGRTLGLRREDAADKLGIKATHFRKEREDKLLRIVAERLLEETAKYRPRRPRRALERDITEREPDLSSEDLSEYEELFSRIWASHWAYRAELIATMRRVGNPNEELEFQEHAGRALWQAARTLHALGAFLDRFGDSILYGMLPVSPEHAVRVAGWSADLTEQEKSYVVYALERAGLENRAGFLRQLERTVRGREVLAKWAELLGEWISWPKTQSPVSG